MHICEYCGKEHDGSYGTGRFCCESCARKYSTIGLKGRTKIVTCKKCGKEFEVSLYANNNYICDECSGFISKIIHINDKRNRKHTNHIRRLKKVEKTCKVCGSKYLQGFGCQNDFCKKHDIRQFRSFIKYFGFDETKLGTLEVETEFNRVRDMLYDLYWNQHLSSIDICKKFNYPNVSNLLDKPFKYLGIPHKSLSEAGKECYFMGRTNPPVTTSFKDAWHNTWDGREVYLRSSYETDYANKLDEDKIYYEVESLRIKYFDSIRSEYRCAIPDFYIPSENTLIEIKSVYTLGGKEGIINLKDKFNAYEKLGYKYKLILEHKEADINSLPENPAYDVATGLIVNKENLNHPGRNGWRLMTNGYVTRKVTPENINKYLEDGWVFGVKRKQ